MIILLSHFIKFQANIKSSVNFCLFGTFADLNHSSPTSYFKKEIQNLTMNKYFCFLEKHAFHTIPVYGNCITGIFFDGDTKIFPSNFEFAPNFFFQPQIDFCTQANIFQKHFFACKNLFFVCIT